MTMTFHRTLTFTVLLVGELVLLRAEANMHDGDVSASEFSLCGVVSQEQRYIDSLYRCRPGDFGALIACEGQRMELRCPRAQFLALRSAVFGWSQTFHMQSDCQHRRDPIRADQDCRLSCALETVGQQCNGRRRCTIDVNSAMFGSRCQPSAMKLLAVLHTCVPRSVQRALDSGYGLDSLADPCENTDFGDRFPAPYFSTTTSTSTTTGATTQTQFPFHWLNPDHQDRYYPGYVATTRGYDEHWPPLLPTSSTTSRYSRTVNTGVVKRPRHDGVQVDDAKRPSKLRLFSLSDWIWTWQFANDNKEKFVLYMVIGLCFGTIAILIAVLFQFAVRQQAGGTSPSGTTRRAKTGRGGGLGSSCGSPTWRDGAGHGMPESESSTGDDRTLHDVEDVELTAFNHHVDSLPRRVGPTTTATGGGGGGGGISAGLGSRCVHQPPSYSIMTRPGSSLAAPATTANINRSYATISAGRCHTPGLAHHHHPTNPALVNGGMTLGHVPNGYGGTGVRYSALPSSSGGGAGIGTATSGGVMVNRGPMIGSLNRSYAGNQYGPLHDFGYPTYDKYENTPGASTGGSCGGGGVSVSGGAGKIGGDTSTPVTKSLHQPIQPHFYD